MKKLGTLYGADLLIDTDDEYLFSCAEKYLKDRTQIKEMTDEELDLEVRTKLGIN